MKVINTDYAPSAIGPYSQAIECDGMLYVSGQLPVNAKTGDLLTDPKEAALQSLTNIKFILEEAGSNVQNIVKVSIFLSDMSLFAEVNEVYGTFFQSPFPARSCVAVKALPKNAILEIECIAKIK